MILITKTDKLTRFSMKWTLDSERIAINSLCDVAFRRTNDMLLELAKPISEYGYGLYEEKYIRCKII